MISTTSPCRVDLAVDAIEELENAMKGLVKVLAVLEEAGLAPDLKTV